MEGCPQVSKSLALELVAELEDQATGAQLLEMKMEEELKWMRDLVEKHEVLRSLPPWLKQKLVVTPGQWQDLPVNGRCRKRMKREGFILHLYAGSDQGYTLAQSWMKHGGGEHKLLEIDVLRHHSHNMLSDEGVYRGLICAALEGKIDAILGGPNCRTRSVLRNYEREGAPRPVRRWQGEEYGIRDGTPQELQQVQDDDILMWRLLFLFMISVYVRRAMNRSEEVKLAMEQPSSPKDYLPQTVSFWDMDEWKKIRDEFDLKEVKMNQGSMGGEAVKPTTFGGNLNLDPEDFKRSRTKGWCEVKNSKDLSRWAPGVMDMLAVSLMKEVMRREPRLKAVSWSEHVALGHVPYRRDCLICQTTQQQGHPHRRVKNPIGGVLSSDTAGPLIPAKDLGGLQARYILVGALTWTFPTSTTKFSQVDEVELEDNAPEIDAKLKRKPRSGVGRDQVDPDPNLPEVEGEGNQDDEPLLPPLEDPEGDLGNQGDGEDEEERPHAEEEEEERPEVEEKKDEAGEERPGMQTRVFRMAIPMKTKTSREVSKVTMEMILRFRVDGFNIERIHSDQGREFAGHFRDWATKRGIHLSRTPGDDPQGNG